MSNCVLRVVQFATGNVGSEIVPGLLETGTPPGRMTPEYFASLGIELTGMPALHANRSICDAPPGLLTSVDLPLRAFAGRFRGRSTAPVGT